MQSYTYLDFFSFQGQNEHMSNLRLKNTFVKLQLFLYD